MMTREESWLKVSLDVRSKPLGTVTGGVQESKFVKFDVEYIFISFVIFQRITFEKSGVTAILLYPDSISVLL